MGSTPETQPKTSGSRRDKRDWIEREELGLADQIVLYHWTTEENAEAIRASGALMPKTKAIPADNSPVAVWFTESDDASAAEWYTGSDVLVPMRFEVHSPPVQRWLPWVSTVYPDYEDRCRYALVDEYGLERSQRVWHLQYEWWIALNLGVRVP